MSALERVGYDGEVVVVTGAGGGLGKAYALLFGSRGAKVVVNDLGVSRSGEGTDSRPADVVVNEIKKLGGVAVADYNSVEEGEKIIQTALDHFGRVDILVNNAGILRDRSFARTSDTDWDLIHRVHLRGSFLVTRAAWPHMKKQNFGRIIMTSSAAGLFGNFGQSNYSAAKMGLVGLCNTLAIEGVKYGIYCNTVVPMGGTRLTDGILPPDLFKSLTPDLVAPLVVWLCHKDCDVTGKIFEAGAGWYGLYRLERTKGFTCRRTLSETVSPETVRSNWDKITDFTDSVHIETISESAGQMAMILEDLKDNEKNPSRSSHSSPSVIEGPLSALGAFQSGPYSYDSLEVILYALGVGASTKDKDGLKFLFEGHDDFSVLPTFPVIPVLKCLMDGTLFSSFPDWTVDLSKLLHGEQYVELIRPIPTEGNLKTTLTVVDILDKGSGALIIIDFEVSDEQNQVISKGQLSSFIVGDGNFGGPRSSTKQIQLESAPSRTPDAVDTFTTSVDQAALYRLSGDRNPLHISPDFAAMGGFEQPILHGLCSYGVAARAVLKRYCDNDVSKFKAIMGRFAKPVIPGQTLETSMWNGGGGRIFYETKVKETGKTCITGGYVDIVDDGASIPSEKKGSMRADDFFERAAKYKKASPFGNQKFLLSWNIMNGTLLSSQWTFDFRQEPWSIYRGEPSDGVSPMTTITVEDDDLISLLNKKIPPKEAYLTGKLKLAGRTFDIKRLMFWFEPQAKL